MGKIGHFVENYGFSLFLWFFKGLKMGQNWVRNQDPKNSENAERELIRKTATQNLQKMGKNESKLRSIMGSKRGVQKEGRKNSEKSLKLVILATFWPKLTHFRVKICQNDRKLCKYYMYYSCTFSSRKRVIFKAYICVTNILNITIFCAEKCRKPYKKWIKSGKYLQFTEKLAKKWKNDVFLSNFKNFSKICR